MQNKLKIKLAAAFCVVCMFFLGTSMTSYAAGMLSIAVSSGTVKSGDTVTVTIYAADSNNAAVGVDMSVTYDTSKLEYVSSSASNASGGGGTVKASGSSVDIKFKAVGSGDAYVKAESATLTAAGTHITVSGTATDTADDNAAKSGDNSLSSLTLSSGTLSPAFKGSVTEYTAQVGSNVNEITVTPVTSNSKATVESITGNKDLKEGTNVISVVVKAENGTTATYKITVTKGAASSGDVGTDQPAEDQPEGNTGDTDTQYTSGDSIIIDGTAYKISEGFTDDQIPEGFKRAPFEYKGSPYEGIVFEDGHLGMYYMVNDAGEGRFFVYDADRDKFYPYVRLSSGDHFIILMVVPNAVIPPDNYEETTLTIGDVSGIMAYQYTGGEDAEIVKVETEEGKAADVGQLDFYIFYGMDSTGVSGWYQYDVKQGTYQRFNEDALSSGKPSEDYESLTKSYNELNDRFKTTKTKDRRLIAIMIFVLVVLLIIILNMFLKIREMGSEEEEEIEEAKPARKSRPKKKQEPRLPKEKVKKKVRPVIEEEPDTDDFYENDDASIMDEFEDDPGVLTRKPKKKAKPAKTPKAETRKQTAETRKQTAGTVKHSAPEPTVTDLFHDDDDIEFFDLNDL